MKPYQKILLVTIACGVVGLAYTQTGDWQQSNCKIQGFDRSSGSGLKLQRVVCN